ncbi:5-oxoprolinase subunit PxpB [Pandoraea sp. PE-S2R-1]|uniref:5-oxoprolinase subunit PxpB n=1 Tax=Pandoraea sp. PE-S2R-1 TaxID=1986994 RepID=UPI001482F2A9|nr:5-oxoprolinase subunit PxpB [Pandoraea sp. PE-S2R-1]
MTLPQSTTGAMARPLWTSRLDNGAVPVSMAGVGGLLLNPSNGTFDLVIQERLLDLATTLRGKAHIEAGVRQVILGVNNLLLKFDPLALHPKAACEMLLALWEQSSPRGVKGKTVEFQVDYGGAPGPDLIPVAELLGMSVADVVRLHSEANYIVAAIGSMPGYAYMVGLPPELTLKRRDVPRVSLPKGSVVIAGVQASVFPMAGPCGWHALGHTATTLFDPHSSDPCLLAPGDVVRFNVGKVNA